MDLARPGTRIVAAMAVVCAGLILGVASARIYQQWRHASERAAARDNQQKFLELNIEGISVGQPFPDIPLLDQTGATAWPRNFLTAGGTLVYTSGDCDACLEALSALCTAIRRSGIDSREVLVVADGQADSLYTLAGEECPNLNILNDDRQVLADQYGVLTFPCAFRLDSMQVVLAMEAGIRTEEEFFALLSGR